jgi:hypothetical protein
MTPSQSEGLDGCEQPQGLPGLKFKSPLRIRRPRLILNRHYHCEGTRNHEHQANATTWTYTDELSDASGQGTIRDHQARVGRNSVLAYCAVWRGLP